MARREHSRDLVRRLGVALALALAVAGPGCGGGNTGAPPPSDMPPGTTKTPGTWEAGPTDQPGAGAATCPTLDDPLWSTPTPGPPAKPVTPRFDLPPGIPMPAASAPGSSKGACRPASGLETLAGSGLSVCCRRARDRHTPGFRRGCMMPLRCVIRAGDGRQASNTTEAARLVGPIDTPAKALGLVALLYSEILDPAEKDRLMSAFSWKGYPGAPAAFEVHAATGGFTVSAPAYSTCGCDHTVFKVTLHVTRAGCVTRTADPAVPLAYSSGLCVD